MGIGWLVHAFVVKSTLGSNLMVMTFEGVIYYSQGSDFDTCGLQDSSKVHNKCLIL